MGPVIGPTDRSGQFGIRIPLRTHQLIFSNDGARQIRAGEIGSLEARSLEDRAIEVRIDQSGSVKIGILEIGAIEIRIHESGAGKIGFDQDGSAQVRTRQVCTRQIGVVQIEVAIGRVMQNVAPSDHGQNRLNIGPQVEL